jgi:predicted Zn-ribbon and HTH transcriptional regulator
MVDSSSPLLPEKQPHPRLEAEGIETIISHPVLCAKCGYNLKGSPVVGVCLSCGIQYNARGTYGTNVHHPGTVAFPVQPVIGAAVTTPFAVVGTVVLIGVFRSGAWAPLFIPLTPALLAVLVVDFLSLGYLWRSVQGLREYVWGMRLERGHRKEIRQEREARRQATETAPTARGPSGPPIDDQTYERLRSLGYSFEINWPTYCANCGYNLRTLPVIGRCPECGTEYNARPLKMINVRSPYGTTLPWGHIWYAAICALITLTLVQWMLTTFYVMTLVFTAAFATGAIIFGRLAARDIQQHVHAQRILRQMDDEEE